MRFVKSLFASAIAIGCISTANATATTWVDTIDFTPDRYIAVGAPANYTHSILDNGYTPLWDSVYGYSLSVNLYDDGDRQREIALVNVLGLSGDRTFFDVSGSEYGGWSLLGYAQLALTGYYDVTITSLTGDFYLGSSTLTVDGNERNPSVAVDEPSTLALFGLGLLGFGALVRRRKSR